ncbi:MAG: hypothetical protein ACFFCI_12480, partial [Promethearchaeota archaeon]
KHPKSILMRPSRVFRLLFRIFIGLLTLSVTLVSFLGGLSAILILGDFDDNIQFDISDAEFNLDINATTFRIKNVNFSLPFNLTNAGYFDMENLKLGIDIALNYSSKPDLNQTKLVKIFNITQNFDPIPQGEKGIFVFIGTNSSFLYNNFPDPSEINKLYGPPALVFYANFTISLDYSLGMHSITIKALNVKVWEFP